LVGETAQSLAEQESNREITRLIREIILPDKEQNREIQTQNRFQNQLIATLFVSNAQPSGVEPDDLFKVTSVVNGADGAGTVEESGCKMTVKSPFARTS
jgi:hypothetical protein